jgi:hypothetical protein
VSPRLRGLHSGHPVAQLTLDEVRAAYLACRDAEALRRWKTRIPCEQCRAAETGICPRHARDLKLADDFARLRVQLGVLIPYQYLDRNGLPR